MSLEGISVLPACTDSQQYCNTKWCDPFLVYSLLYHTLCKTQGNATYADVQVIKFVQNHCCVALFQNTPIRIHLFGLLKNYHEIVNSVELLLTAQQTWKTTIKTVENSLSCHPLSRRSMSSPSWALSWQKEQKSSLRSLSSALISFLEDLALQHYYISQ